MHFFECIYALYYHLLNLPQSARLSQQDAMQMHYFLHLEAGLYCKVCHQQIILVLNPTDSVIDCIDVILA
jgi:hypothetical protein